MVESTQVEPGTLSYDWWVSEDGSAVHIYERYADSDALVTHITGFGEKFAGRFLAMVDPGRFTVYGEPNDEARESDERLQPDVPRKLRRLRTVGRPPEMTPDELLTSLAAVVTKNL